MKDFLRHYPAADLMRPFAKGLNALAGAFIGLPKHAAIILIACYRSFLSPYFSGQCRFHPTCSEYAERAFRDHGFLIGFLLTTRRIGRCHPYGGFGFDPVPERPQHE